MSTVVPITITVTDANAAAAVDQVTMQLNALGPAGEEAGAKASAGLDQVSGHALTARDNVRLLSEEMGLRVPRAMQSVIAHSQLMMGVISALGPAMIAIGGADILMHIGESAYAAYQKYVLLKDVIDDSNTVIKSFGDSAEAAMNRASEATERYIRLTQGAQAADTYKLDRLQPTGIGIPQYQSDQFKKLPDAVKGDFEKITGESVMPKDLDAAIAKLMAYESTQQAILKNFQAIQAAGIGPNREVGSDDVPGTVKFSQEMAQQQKRVDIGAGLIAALKAQQDDYAAQVKTDQAQITEDGKRKAEEAAAKEKEKVDAILSLENSARNAQLSGFALLEAQHEEAIGNFVRKYRQSRAAINAIDMDYGQKELELWQKQWEEADKVMRTAQQAAQQQAHTGAGSIENSRQNSLADIAGKKLDAPGAADEMRAAYPSMYS